MVALHSIGSLSQTLYQNSLVEPDEESYIAMLRETVEGKICYLRETCDPLVFDEKVNAEMVRMIASRSADKNDIGFLKWCGETGKDIKKMVKELKTKMAGKKNGKYEKLEEKK